MHATGAEGMKGHLSDRLVSRNRCLALSAARLVRSSPIRGPIVRNSTGASTLGALETRSKEPRSRLDDAPTQLVPFGDLPATRVALEPADVLWINLDSRSRNLKRQIVSCFPVWMELLEIPVEVGHQHVVEIIGVGLNGSRDAERVPPEISLTRIVQIVHLIRIPTRLEVVQHELKAVTAVEGSGSLDETEA